MDAIKHSDEFKLLADLAPAMLWRAKADRAYDWFNLSWLAFTGQVLEDAVGPKGWIDFIHPGDVERFQRSVDDAFRSQEAFSLEYRLRRRDGVFRWMLDNGRPYFQDGRFAGFFGSCVDISDHRSIERDLRVAMEERDVLLREVHHRVKNNMQTLMALVRFMRRTADPSGRTLLDILNARLVSMSIVQRYLHAADNMTEVSVRTLLHSIANQLAETELGVDLGLVESNVDLILPAQAAAYTGLAAAEAAVLLTQCGAALVRVELHDGPTPKVEVWGAAKGCELARSQLGMRLVRQYARGAGAATQMYDRDEDQALIFEFPYGHGALDEGRQGR